MTQVPEARLKIIAENLARAALQELQRDVRGAGTEANRASVGFGKMVFQNGHLVASTSTARRGLSIMENGLRTLAFQAAGIPGPVGKVASGFGLLGAGSLVVTGVVAGAGAMALGYRILTRDARAASAAADKLTESLKQQTLGGQLRAIQAPLAESGARAFRSAGVAQTDGGFNPFLHLIAAIRERQNVKAGEDAVEAVLGVRGKRDQDHTTLIRQLRMEGDAVGATAEQAARARAAYLGLNEAKTAEYVEAAVRLERRKEENRALEIQRDLLVEIEGISASVAHFFTGPESFPTFAQETIAGIHVPGMDEILGRSKFGVGIDETIAQAFAEDTKRADFDFASPFGKQPSEGKAVIEGSRREGVDNLQAAQLGLMGITSLARSGGSAGGILGGLGGLAGGAAGLQGVAGTALAGPLGWAGLGLSALSTGFGLLSNNADKNADKVVKAIERQAKAITEQRATIVVIGPDGHATRTALQRLEDSDAVERIPGPVGAGG